MQTKISRASIADAQAILDLTKRAFRLYSDELPEGTPVYALSETIEDVQRDITQNNVYIATYQDTIIGTVRWQRLSRDIAYLYRFAVDPLCLSSGVGSDLLSQVITDCMGANLAAIALHTNARYYKLARYYYGREFFVHSTTTSKGYIRALFVKELKNRAYDLGPAFLK